MMDSNDLHTKELEPIMTRKGLKELYVHRHGANNEPETHIRGSTRIDFMYGSAGVQQSVRQCGIGAYADFCMTDHRHMFADLDLGELLAGHPPEIAEQEHRVLVTQNPRYKKIYKEKLKSFLDEHKLADRQRTAAENVAKAQRVTKDLQDELEDID